MWKSESSKDTHEIYAVIVDTICSKRKTIRIAGDDKPKEVVHGQFMKLEANHIRYVLSVLGQASNIRNAKQYLLQNYDELLVFSGKYNSVCFFKFGMDFP